MDIVPSPSLYTHGLPDASTIVASPLPVTGYNTNELMLQVDLHGNKVVEEMRTLPIETNSTGKLQLIPVITRGEPSTEPDFPLISPGDDKPTGEHRLVQIHGAPFWHE
ncbi:MAG: hypothetical protein RLZZ200_1539 [Pseudomonadota bacterium]